MRNYLRENIERYRRTARAGGPADYDDFSSRGFLDEVIPRLALHRDRPRVLELGTGIGPGAVYLAERGFAVHAVDVIPEAIAQARLIAAERGLDVCFEVMDVTRIPGHGPAYDLVVDSYCLQGIVLDADREAVFRAVKARLHPRGCYLVSSAMYAASRHRPDRQVVDGRTGRVFDRYDEESLFDPATATINPEFPDGRHASTGHAGSGADGSNDTLSVGAGLRRNLVRRRARRLVRP